MSASREVRTQKVLCDSFFFSSRRRHTRWPRDWSSDVCSSDLRGVLISRGIPCPPARKSMRVRLRTCLSPAGVRTYATLTPPLSNCHLFLAALCDNSPKLREVDHTTRAGKEGFSTSPRFGNGPTHRTAIRSAP